MDDDRDALREILLGEDGQPIRWPWPDRPPTPQGRRLMASLGVVGVPPVTAVSAQALLETRDCAAPLCTSPAIRGSEHCRRHASIAEIRAANDDPSGLEALARMDAGEPQALEPELEPQASRRPQEWTRETIVAALQRWAGEHEGRPPSSKEWVRRGDYWPAFTTVVKRFGTWGAAVVAAGFPRPTSGGQPGNVNKARRPASSAAAPEAAPAGTATPAGTAIEVAKPEAAELAEAPDDVVDGEIVPTASFAALAAELEAAYHAAEAARARLAQAGQAFSRHPLYHELFFLELSPEAER